MGGKSLRAKGVIIVLTVGVVALATGLAVWSPGLAQIGVQAHNPDATPNAVPRSRAGEDGVVVPTAVAPGQPPPGSEHAQSASASSIPADPIERLMRERQQQRQREEAALPAPAATARAEQIEHSKAEALARLTPSPGPSPTLSRGPSPVQEISAGLGVIIDDPQTPLRPQAFAGLNQWRKEIAPGRYLSVWAGSEGGGGITGPTRQGALFVAVHGDTWSDLEQTGFYPTPQVAGAVRVVGATGDRLTLLSQDGATFIFDASSRIFLSSAGLPIPPGPTATPFSSPQAQ